MKKNKTLIMFTYLLGVSLLVFSGLSMVRAETRSIVTGRVDINKYQQDLLKYRDNIKLLNTKLVRPETRVNEEEIKKQRQTIINTQKIMLLDILEDMSKKNQNVFEQVKKIVKTKSEIFVQVEKDTNYINQKLTQFRKDIEKTDNIVSLKDVSRELRNYNSSLDQNRLRKYILLAQLERYENFTLNTAFKRAELTKKRLIQMQDKGQDVSVAMSDINKAEQNLISAKNKLNELVSVVKNSSEANFDFNKYTLSFGEIKKDLQNAYLLFVKISEEVNKK